MKTTVFSPIENETATFLPRLQIWKIIRVNTDISGIRRQTVKYAGFLNPEQFIKHGSWNFKATGAMETVVLENPVGSRIKSQIQKREDLRIIQKVLKEKKFWISKGYDKRWERDSYAPESHRVARVG